MPEDVTMNIFDSLINAISSFFKNIRIRREADAERRRIERQRQLEREQYERSQRTYRIGNDFERYVISMFDPSMFTLIHRTPTNEDTDGKFVESMKYPDLRFRENSTGTTFWVEVKYRARPGDRGEITWCTDHQLRTYKETALSSGDPVFIIMGVGGYTQAPKKVYCLDLKKINFTTLYYSTYAANIFFNRSIRSFNDIKMVSSRIYQKK